MFAEISDMQHEKRSKKSDDNLDITLNLQFFLISLI